MLSSEMVTEMERAAWFSRTTKPYLVVDTRLRIRAVNRRYEEATGHPRSVLLGEELFDVFPDNPADPHADGVKKLSASLEQVFSTGQPHCMGLQHYDVRDLSAPERFVHKVWAPLNAPMDRDGRTVAVLHHVEDVTAAEHLAGGEDSPARLDLRGHAEVLAREFPSLGFPTVIAAVACAHQMVVRALDAPDRDCAERLARLKLGRLAGQPAGHPEPASRTTDNGLEVLGDAECRRLLHTQNVGRVAVTIGALPAIFPVDYRVRGNSIYFRSGAGTKLNAALAHSVVAFEVDLVDPVHQSGWSVQVVGHARPVPDSRWHDQVQPWAGGKRETLVEIDIAVISGRRIHRGIPEG